MKCKSKKIEWNEEQDKLICTLVKRYGTKKWSKMSQQLNHTFGGRQKSGKQCRQRYFIDLKRWYNHLDPNISKNQWTRFQQDLLFSLHKQHGNKWTVIAQKLKGRNDNSIKNHFYSTIRKSLRRIDKFLGSKNSTIKVQKIKSLTLTKLFYLADQEQLGINSPLKIREFSQELRCKELAYHLINFSRTKLCDQKGIVCPEDMKKLEKLLQELNLINNIYEKEVIESEKIKPIKTEAISEQLNLKAQLSSQKQKRIVRNSTKIKPIGIEQQVRKKSGKQKKSLLITQVIEHEQQIEKHPECFFLHNDDDIEKYISNNQIQEPKSIQIYQKPKMQEKYHGNHQQFSHPDGFDFFVQMPQQNYPEIMVKNNSPWISISPGLATPSQRKYFSRKLDPSSQNHQSYYIISETIQKQLIRKSFIPFIDEEPFDDLKNWDTKENNKDL